MAGLFILLTSLFEGERPAWTAFDDIGELLAAVLATVACAIRVRRERLLLASLCDLQRSDAPQTLDVPLQRQTTGAWLLLTSGFGAWAIGQAAWSIYEVGLGVTPPSPSWLDALFLGSSLLTLAGLLSMVRTAAGALSHARGVAEGLFIAAGCLLLSWSLIGGAVVESDASALSQVVNLAYPALDAMAFAAVVFVAVRRGRDLPSGLGLLALGIVCLAVSDSAFWYLSAVEQNVAGATPLDGGWVAGFLLIALGALRHRAPAHWQLRLADSRMMPALPGLPAAAGVFVVAVGWLSSGNIGNDEPLVGVLAALVVLSVALLMVVSYENRALMGDREGLEERLRRQAFHDPLTGLANRALLTDRAAQSFARSRRTGASVGVIALDIDSFKLINDRRGHMVGDQLLRAVAQRLNATVRPQDTVARTGGDEFVVLVDDIESADDALALARRIHEAIHPPFELGPHQLLVAASVGVAVGSAPHSNFDQLLSDADVALYAVKLAGRDAVELFESEMHDRAREHLTLQTELREGLQRGEFRVVYQPEFDRDGTRLEGFEALVRWENPKRGLMYPERFIPLAEESGLIVPLGRWVLEQALEQAASWQQTPGEPPLRISVNVSAVQLNSPSLPEDLHKALSKTGVDPGRVVLEITESSLVESSPRVSEVLHALKRIGVLLAIDDFGTGYASISYLQRIPVDILKVDRSFVSRIGEKQRDGELLEAIVNIGRVLSLQTIAEGVEDSSQLEHVKQAGCDLVQGHLFSHPLQGEEAQRLASAHARATPATQPAPPRRPDSASSACAG